MRCKRVTRGSLIMAMRTKDCLSSENERTRAMNSRRSSVTY